MRNETSGGRYREMPTYYELHREHCLALAKAYRLSHKEQIAKKQAEFYQKVNKARRAFDRKLWRIDNPRPPNPVKPFTIKTTRTYYESVPKTPKVKRGPFPDLATVKDFTPVSSGQVTQQPGIFLDWNNL